MRLCDRLGRHARDDRGAQLHKVRRPPTLRARSGPARARRGRPCGRFLRGAAFETRTKAHDEQRSHDGLGASLPTHPRGHVCRLGEAPRNASRAPCVHRRRARVCHQRARVQHHPRCPRPATTCSSSPTSARASASSARRPPWTSSPGTHSPLSAPKTCSRAQARRFEPHRRTPRSSDATACRPIRSSATRCAAIAQAESTACSPGLRPVLNQKGRLSPPFPDASRNQRG